MGHSKGAATQRPSKTLVAGKGLSARAMKAAAAEGAVKKKRRWKSGTVALREIKRYQSGTERLIPRANFDRVVRDIVADYSFNPSEPLRLQAGVVDTLQEVTEVILAGMFNKSVIYMAHAKRKMIYPTDIRLNPATEELFKQKDAQQGAEADRLVHPPLGTPAPV